MTCRNIKIVILLLFSACTSGKTDYLSFKNRECINAFPDTVFCSNKEKVVNIPGLLDLSIVDSVLLISRDKTNGCISAYDFCGDSLFCFLNIGKGPNEVLIQPFVSCFDIVHSDDETHALYYDPVRKYIDFNLSDTFTFQQSSISSIDIHMPAHVLQVKTLNDSTLIYKCANESNSGYERIIMCNENRVDCKPASILNDICVSVKKDKLAYNIIGYNYIVNENSGLIVESAQRLNIINLYSVNGDYYKTIYIGNHLMSTKDVEGKNFFDIPVIISDLRAYQDCFACLCELKECSDSSFDQAVLIFSWEGTPLQMIVLDEKITGFDIDNSMQLLIGMNDECESVYYYKINNPIGIEK